MLAGSLTLVAADSAGRVGGGLWEIVAAMISAVTLASTAFGAPLFLDWYRRRRRSVNHVAESEAEQSALANRLMTELEAVRAELTAEREANANLRGELRKALGVTGQRRHRG